MNLVSHFKRMFFSFFKDDEPQSVQGPRIRIRQQNSSMTLVTKVVLIIIFTVFLIAQVMIYIMDIKDSSVAVILGGLFTPFVLEANAYWLLLTSGFLHLDILHIASNAFSFLILSRLIEKIYTQKQYLAILLGSIIIGNLLSLSFSQTALSYGISGGVFGMLGAYGVYVLETGLYKYPPIRNQLLYVLLINLVIGLAASNINLIAHFGGFLGGGLLATAFAKKESWKSLRLQSALALLLFVVILIVIVLQKDAIEYYWGNILDAVNFYAKMHMSWYGDYLMKMLQFGG